MRLTPKGEQVARQLAMTDEDGQDALMGALLGDPRDSRRPAPVWDGPHVRWPLLAALDEIDALSRQE